MFITLLVSTFFIMEFVAWFTHKYVMHGFLWVLHKDHHVPDPELQPLERNDFFFLFFATPGITLIGLGQFAGVPYCEAIGFGITAYGFCYFLVHDIFIHQRIKWFRNSNNVYLRSIRRAHKIHHKHRGKEHGECFGMLLVPIKYFRAEVKRKK